MKAEIKSFCLEYGYPEDSVQTLLAEFDKLKKLECYPLFKAYVQQYNTDDTSFSYTTALMGMKGISAKTGLNEYTLVLLLFLCFAKHCRELYDEAQLPVKAYHDAMLDLKCKMLECHNVYGVWGTFVGSWFPRFFELSRFALGRLQFEDDAAIEPYEKHGIKLNYGDWVINTHIPSGKPLDTEECLKSFRMAAEFFADRFPDGIAKFRCYSWLLADVNQKFLAPDTRIRKFANLFDVVRTDPAPKGEDLWRIFGIPYEGTTEGFPEETSLQRGYLKHLSEGKSLERGLGFLFIKDGKILS